MSSNSSTGTLKTSDYRSSLTSLQSNKQGSDCVNTFALMPVAAVIERYAWILVSRNLEGAAAAAAEAASGEASATAASSAEAGATGTGSGGRGKDLVHV
jgi:hypothetical protein